MAKLTAAQRKQIPPENFALPGGRYPVENKPHAANAKARASQQFARGMLSAGEKSTVDAAANRVLGKTKKSK